MNMNGIQNVEMASFYELPEKLFALMVAEPSTSPRLVKFEFAGFSFLAKRVGQKEASRSGRINIFKNKLTPQIIEAIVSGLTVLSETPDIRLSLFFYKEIGGQYPTIINLQFEPIPPV